MIFEHIPDDHTPNPSDPFLASLSHEENRTVERALSLDLGDLSPGSDATFKIYYNPFLPPINPAEIPWILRRVKFEMCFLCVRAEPRFSPDLIGTIQMELLPGPNTRLKLMTLMFRMAEAIVRSYLTDHGKP